MIAEIIKKRKICQHAFYRDSGKLKVKKIELNRNFTLSLGLPKRNVHSTVVDKGPLPFQPLKCFHVLIIALKTIFIDENIIW